MLTRHGPGFYAQRHAPSGAVGAEPNRVRFQGARGFTLIELIVTVVIVAILTAIAVPVISSTTPVQEASALLGALQYARSAAIKQGQWVVICPASVSGTANLTTSGAVSCSTGTSWSGGWIVLQPSTTSNGCASVGGGSTDVILQAQNKFTNADTATFSVTPSSGNGNTAFCFGNSGFSMSSNTGVVQFDSSPVKLANRRCVAVTGVGHVQLLTAGQTDTLGQITCPAT